MGAGISGFSAGLLNAFAPDGGGDKSELPRVVDHRARCLKWKGIHQSAPAAELRVILEVGRHSN